MEKDTFQNICKAYKQNYVNIFQQIYPAKNRTGFTERNLSVNFSKAYENVIRSCGQRCITWYEFQFGCKNNEHYDAIIINTMTKEILVIESKRFNMIPRKIKSVNEDIKRINKFRIEISAENFPRIPDFNQYKVYGIILADIWTGDTTSRIKKINIKRQYSNQCFLNENQNLLPNGKNLNVFYDVQDFSDCPDIKQPSIQDYYSLLSMIWEINENADNSII